MSSLCILLQIVTFFVLSLHHGISDATTEEFPEYSYRNHPLHTLPAFDSFSTRPVAMNKYFFHEDGNKSPTENAVFAPKGASYNVMGSSTKIFDRADVLFSPDIDLMRSNRNLCTEIHLNFPARIFVLLNAPKFQRRSDTTSSVNGAPSDWRFISAVERVGDGILSEEKRSHEGDGPATLPEFAVVMEVPRSSSLLQTFPHWRTMHINGELVKRMHIIMVPQSETSFPVTGFPSPSIPSRFRSFLEPRGRVVPSMKPPVPNRDCPAWLHDLYITDDYYSERKFWRTWHPQIDTIYWCYFDHEHGSFPGMYRPKFHYTPSRTPDNRTSTGHQLESHAGFKVFSFVVPKDGRIVVLVVHIHLSIAERFYARFHTVIFTVHRKIRLDEWSMEMELQMKMDFGAPMASFVGYGLDAYNREGREIAEELGDRWREAFRKFNVLNIDRNFPRSLDRRFVIRGDISKGPEDVRIGNYEKWKGPLNTCSGSTVGRFNRGLVVDVRDPQTAIRSVERSDDSNLQELRGRGRRRVLIMPENEVIVSTDYCEFEGSMRLEDRGSDGVFYTDHKFSRIVREERNTVGVVRQYIRHGFRTLNVDNGEMTQDDAWLGIMSSTAGYEQSIKYIERSVMVMKN